MDDLPLREGVYDELKFARQQGFLDRSKGVTLLIGGGFALLLFLFLHFREVRVESLELNSVAEKYIVAQTDFEFLDEEASIILRQESVRDIDRIFKLNDKEVRQRRLEFENYLIYNQDWRKLAEHSTFEEMYRAVNLLEACLTRLRLTDPRTLQKMKELYLPVSDYVAQPPPGKGEEGEEMLPEEVWHHCQTTAFVEDIFQPGTLDFILSYFKARPWKMEEDVATGRSLRKMVQSRIPDKYTKVSAGDRIIDQGERVTNRHLAMLQAMKNALDEQRNLWHPWTLGGTFFITFVLLYVCYAYFRTYYPEFLKSNRRLVLVVTITSGVLLLAKITEWVLLNTPGGVAEVVRYPIVVPIAAILLCSLTSPGIATFVSGFLAIVITLSLDLERRGFMLINLASAVVAILHTRSLRHRKEVFIVAVKAWLAAFGLILGIHFYEQTLFEGPGLAADVLSSLGFMLLTAVLVVGFLPLLESAFGIMTDVTLMEYMDPNHELLRRLSIEAPGTYQHSLVVGNLSEAAATAIGANGLFCRVSTLYHDVGKLMTPHYFTENQQGTTNMHQLLTPLESAQVIIAHVSEGVVMARKAGLPEQFVDVIKEHHGTTLVYYFYAKQVEQMGGDASMVDEKDFRYMGPRPRSKESAIIMIADSFEAASRSLDEVNEETLTSLIDKLVTDKAADGQFDKCLLTFEELGIVKEVMVKTIVAAGHSRIKYPHRETVTPLRLVK